MVLSLAALINPLHVHNTDSSLAGQPMENVAGSKTSVYIGNFTRDYSLLLQKEPEFPAKYSMTSLTS